MANVSKPGISGQDFDKFVQNEELRIGEDDSKINKLQQRYWEAKQVFISKLKRKEDDCVVASDAPLDAKLELFRSIEDTCCNLLYILEGYQDRLCALAHEENSTGRFLKECGKLDKTRAGKVMTASGKTLSYTAQQRIQLRNPLVRLYQEVETFQYRAIADTMLTVERMEKARVAYRGALLWMKDLSQQLDPDTYKQLEKFRKVQAQVRRTKARFDKLKTDTQQKIDMLCASRCNMFSHALVLYQNSLSNFFERTAKTMKILSENFKGYQHYEFSLLKDLTETSKKLTQEDGPIKFEEILRENIDDKDALIFFESEYTDEAKPSSKDTKTGGQAKTDEESSLINFGNITTERRQKFQDLLDSAFKSDNMNLLNDIFEPVHKESANNQSSDSFMPSNLLDSQISSKLLNSDLLSESTSLTQISTSTPNAKSNPPSSQPPKEKKSSWLDLFAELDPLSNPDALGSMEDQDRNC